MPDREPTDMLKQNQLKSRNYLPGYFLIAFIICLSSQIRLYAQQKEYAKFIVDTLASESMYGRGYVNDANRIASEFIANEMKKSGLKNFGEEYFQPFTLPMNAFPGKVNLTVDGKKLTPGIDFVLSSSSPSISGKFKLKELGSRILMDKDKMARLKGRDFSKIILIIDKSKFPKEKQILADSLIRTNFLGAAGYILLSDRERLIYSVSAGYQQKSYPVFEVMKTAFASGNKSALVEIEAIFKPDVPIRNVIGFIQGAEFADSFLVFTAHFDHIGMMGTETLFPGANDNATGVAMMLDLAGYFSLPTNRPRYSIAFIALSGEEAGLKGSEFYVEHPKFPLKQISFLINLDMVGTGSEGVTVVNGTIFKTQFERLVKINADNEYVLKVAPRGESCNSDHCPFYRKGVPAVFIYSMGKEHREYHNIYDKADAIPFTEYDDIFRLINDFVRTY